MLDYRVSSEISRRIPGLVSSAGIRETDMAIHEKVKSVRRRTYYRRWLVRLARERLTAGQGWVGLYNVESDRRCIVGNTWGR